jgi:Acetyltransferase (GNAT) family
MEPVTDGGYALEPVDDLDPGRVSEVRRIYEDGFAPHLRADFASLTSGREDDESALALMQGGEPRGFVMLRPLGPHGWMFLRYLVAGQRGQGLGGIMWDQLMAWLRASGSPLLVWDVEDPDEPGCDPAEVQIRNRRIRFYERHGGYLLPVRGYGNPHDDDVSHDSVSHDSVSHDSASDGSGSDGSQHWTPMRLMAASVGDAGLPRTPAIVAAVYRYRWRLDPDDPQIAATEVTATEVTATEVTGNGAAAAAGPDHDQKGA